MIIEISKLAYKFVSAQTKKAVKMTARYPIANSKPVQNPCLVHIPVRNYSSLREHGHCLYIREQMQWQPYKPEQEYHDSLLLMTHIFYLNYIMLQQQKDPDSNTCKVFPTKVSGISYSNTQALFISGTTYA